MAGQAAKKAAKAEASTASLYFPIIVAVNTLYICFRGELVHAHTIGTTVLTTTVV